MIEKVLLYSLDTKKKGKEIPAYIDYRERLKNDEMEGIFKEGKPLLPKPTDLSYYNWTFVKGYE